MAKREKKQDRIIMMELNLPIQKENIEEQIIKAESSLANTLELAKKMLSEFEKDGSTAEVERLNMLITYCEEVLYKR